MNYDATVRNWQLHHLSYSREQIDRVYPGRGAQPIVFTGTIVDDPSGKRRPGDHMRSSLIISIDRDNNIIKTITRTYKVQDEGNDIFEDMGDEILKIFY